jgi:hypothetical protein
MKKLVVLIALAMGFTAHQAHADIMIEPYLGYEFGTQEQDQTTGSSSSEKTTYTTLGARLGYHSMIGLWVVADASKSSGKMTSDLYDNNDLDRTSIYGVVGFNLPILFRVWAGYAISNELKLKDDDVKLAGNGTKFGVGFTGLPFVSINLEMFKQDWKKADGDDLSEKYDKFDDTSYLLSVSLPLDF